MITFVVFTYNEEKRIERVIQNLQSYGKVLLADNNSTDGTLEIAQRYNCNVFFRKEEYVYVENQKLVNQLYDVIDTEWIYWAFADEMLEIETLEEITKIVKANSHDIITMDRKNYFYGNFCHDLYHARTFKMFKKHAIDFTDNPIHSMGKATVSKDRIYDLHERYFIHHFISNTASSYLNVINRYTESELESTSSFDTSFFKFIYTASKILVKDLFNSKIYKTGFSNIALSQLMLTYVFVKNMKLYEKFSNLNTENIESNNNKERDKILQRFNI